MKLQREMTSAQQLVTEICELYTAAAEERGLTLEFFVTGGDCWLLMDRKRIQQALANYLDNALAYTPSGGVVSVHLEIEAHEIVIRVCDTGPGLKDIDPSRIWKRFARGSAASASAPGIGLGLSLVRAIAHAHRGSTGCQNRSGMKGAEFWIRLPILR
jgi:signal transduction histidine kinase